MKVGNPYIWMWLQNKKPVYNIAVVLKVNEYTVIVNIRFPADEGELREVKIDSVYTRRSELILHSRNPGVKISESRKEVIRTILRGNEKT